MSNSAGTLTGGLAFWATGLVPIRDVENENVWQPQKRWKQFFGDQ